LTKVHVTDYAGYLTSRKTHNVWTNKMNKLQKYPSVTVSCRWGGEIFVKSA